MLGHRVPEITTLRLVAPETAQVERLALDLDPFDHDRRVKTVSSMMIAETTV